MKRMHTSSTSARAVQKALGLSALAWLATASLSASAVEPALEAHMSANRVETRGGSEVLKPADKAAPGDLIEYRAHYVNKGAVPVPALSATIPIPPGAEYRHGSAQPDHALASADGVNFAAMPLKRTVRLYGGKTREENVPVREYRALRWDLGALPGGKDATVCLRVSVTGAVTGAVK